MKSFANIVIFHPAAIGDAVLATPVSTTLKLNFPGAKITYWSHPSLKSLLLELCPAIDEFVEFQKDLGFWKLRKQLLALKPDLFIDLSNSSRGYMLPILTGIETRRYEKESETVAQPVHAVGNFLATIKDICGTYPQNLFPTLYPDVIAEELIPQLVEMHRLDYRPLIGLVCGVGSLRPHRAWIPDGWIYLVKQILDCLPHTPVFIGGTEDYDLAQRINAECGNRGMNLCGQLQLPETAAVLKCCDVVVSGDTGPAHIAVAVGTPVVGLYGPTNPLRSGPYGCSAYLLDQSESCECLGAKICHLAGPAQPGECMGRIMLPEVMAKIRLALGPDYADVNTMPSLDEDLSPPGVAVDPAVMAEFLAQYREDKKEDQQE
ncbi:MAG: glycosyltransferase family 9 protein [Candidatus Melainabacteria bacterium]|nr:glycosyltransferase family 9 protein [Candidatus Melainabacteria bacterium]